MSWLTFSGRLLAVVGLSGLAGCYDVYDLGIQGPSSMLAVGANAIFHLQYALFFNCTTDRVLRCGAGNYNQIVQTTAVSVDDPRLLQATLAANGDIQVRAVAAGTAKLSATGIDAKGNTQSESRTLRIMTPDGVSPILTGPCLTAPMPTTWTVAVGSDLPLEMVVKSGTNELFADGWMPNIDPGPLTLLSGSYPFRFKAPGTPIDGQVKIGLPSPFSLPVRVYAPSQIDSVWLSARKPGPYIPNQQYPLDIAPAVGGKPICQEAMPQTVVSVSILTPDLCVFQTGDGQSVMNLPSPQTGATLRSISIVVLNKPGTCRVQASLPTGSATTTIDLPIAN